MAAEIPRRNVYVFSASSGAEVAGFFQHGGVSISTFTNWINEISHIPTEWALYPSQSDNNRAAGGAALDSTSADEIQPGRYVIRTPPPDAAQTVVYLTTDVPRTRAYSVNDTHTAHVCLLCTVLSTKMDEIFSKETNFVTRIRARDRRCCITGERVAGNDYTGFEVAHIFPLSETDIWNALNYKRFIEDDQIQPGFEMNSIQQGFLCSSTQHCMFDDYSIGVNPDDNYRIYDFVGRDPIRSPHGRVFFRNLNEQSRYLPSPDLLRDHFRQCVLRHVKGAGKNNAQRRFDPDLDLHGGLNLETGSWWSGSQGKKQLEAELAGRLWGLSLDVGQTHH